MNFHFKLVLYCEKNGSKEKQFAGDIIRESAAGNSVNIDKDSCTIDFVYNGITYISNSWNLGRPDWLLPQVENAVQQIKIGQRVFIRSAVIEGSEIPFILFETNASAVNISMMIFDDYEIEQIFPAGPFAENSADLYNYFDTNRMAIFQNIEAVIRNNPGYTERFTALEVPTAALLESLEIIIRQVEQLF